MALERELAAFRARLPELAADEGKFALVRGEALVGVFGTYEEAITSGYVRFRLERFFVKEIRAVERPHLITRVMIRPELVRRLSGSAV